MRTLRNDILDAIDERLNAEFSQVLIRRRGYIERDGTESVLGWLYWHFVDRALTSNHMIQMCFDRDGCHFDFCLGGAPDESLAIPYTDSDFIDKIVQGFHNFHGVLQRERADRSQVAQ
jgi:hypothetical protein